MALLRESLASGDETTMRRALDKVTKDTLPFIPLGREYPETDLERECIALWHEAATLVHGELPAQSATSRETEDENV